MWTSTNQFSVALKEQARHCEFGTFYAAALRDRLVCGLTSELTKRRLLLEEALNFDKALALALFLEKASHEGKAFGQQQSAASSGSNQADINKVGVRTRKP